tara:strand:- start:698 stop:880 length:183 start_codon:yes stop_codon:yes gene_type:complete
MTEEQDKYSKKAKKIAGNVMQNSLRVEKFINTSLLKLEKIISRPFDPKKKIVKNKQEKET